MAKWFQIGRVVFTWVLAACVLTVCVVMAYATWCAITNGVYTGSGDYVRYVTMLWNTAHGRPFYTTEDSYLYQHLSFSLAPLSLIYLVVDHPLTFAWFAFAFMIAGAGIVAAAARRAGVSWTFIFALLLYWCGYHFMHEIQMAAFHTVTAYLVLIPLLYWAILARRGAAISLVLALILGLREEAGLMVIPLLLYFAVRERWRAGYIYAGLALAYVVLAVTVLFPMINHIGLFERRTKEFGGGEVDPEMWRHRLVSLCWIALPALPLLRRGWKPLLVIPSVAILTSLLSLFYRQYQMAVHYPAVIVATLAVAMLETLRQREEVREGGGGLPLLAAAWLLLVTSVSYFTQGMLPGSPSQPHGIDLVYKRPGKALRALEIAKHIPQAASVGADYALAGFVANRADLLWARTSRDPKLWTMDYIFFRARSMAPELQREQIAAGNFELLLEQDGYVILKRRQPSVPSAN